MFERTFFAGWGEMDFNSHMKNTAYLDKSADLRLMFFAESGFPASEFARLRLGPVVMKDTIEYFKEIHLLEEIRVTLALQGVAENGSRFALRNEFFRKDGKLAVRVTSMGGWLDQAARKLSLPPPALLAALRSLSPTSDFEILNPSVA